MHARARHLASAAADQQRPMPGRPLFESRTDAPAGHLLLHQRRDFKLRQNKGLAAQVHRVVHVLLALPHHSLREMQVQGVEGVLGRKQEDVLGRRQGAPSGPCAVSFTRHSLYRHPQPSLCLPDPRHAVLICLYDVLVSWQAVSPCGKHTMSSSTQPPALPC